jgi:hypothetical protein
MEIPLVLRQKKDGSFSYSMPLAYRIAMAIIFAILAVVLFLDGASPGVGGWIAIALVALAALYEESWKYSANGGELVHRVGILPFARRRAIAKGYIARFKIEPFVRGTVPGSADEAEEKAAALAGGRADDSGKKRARYKKPYLCLVCETEDGERFFMNAADARKGDKLKMQAAHIARSCGVSLVEGSL